jgi:hypothetical protein
MNASLSNFLSTHIVRQAGQHILRFPGALRLQLAMTPRLFAPRPTVVSRQSSVVSRQPPQRIRRSLIPVLASKLDPPGQRVRRVACSGSPSPIAKLSSCTS